MKFKSLIFMAITVFLLSTCNLDIELQNKPIINRLVSEKSICSIREKIEVTVEAKGQNLKYDWLCTSGQLLEPQASSTIWIAPETPGTATLVVIVTSKESGESIQQNLTITIRPAVESSTPGEAIVTLPNGNVGINQTDPRAALDVNGSGIFGENLTIGGELGVNGNSRMNGDLTVDGNLQVTGNVIDNSPVRFSAAHTLSAKLEILPGATSVVEFPIHLRPRGTSYRYVLWVNVAGDNNVTMTTTIEIEVGCTGCIAAQTWVPDSTIGSWTISGRDWTDNYIDMNISRSTSFRSGFNNNSIRIKNTGSATVEIFAIGIIMEGISNGAYIQQ